MAARSVIIDDGFQLHGCVLDATGQVTGTAVVDDASDLDVALGELKKALGAAREVIVVSAEVRAGSIALPPGVVGNLGFAELNQMVQFEMTATLGRGSAMLGEIFLHRGYMSSEQLATLLDQQRASRRDPSQGGFKPLGALAQEAGYLDSSQLESCLHQQSRINLAEPATVPLAGVGQAAPATAYGSQHATPVSLVGQEVRDRWLVALKKKGFKLAGLLPLIGSCSGLLKEQFQETTGAVIQLHATFAGVVQVNDGNATSIETISFGGKPLDKDRLVSLLQRINSPVKVVLPASDTLAELVKSTGEHATPQLHLLADESGLWSRVAQSVDRASKQPARLNAPGVPLKNPRKPLSQGPLAPWAVAIMILAAALVVGEWLIEQKLEPKRAKLDKQTKEHIALDEQIEQYSEWDFGIDQELERRDAMLAEVLPVEARNDLVENVLTTRTSFYGRFLKLLMETVGEGVIIDGLASNGGEAFTVDVWSINPAQGGLFVEEITRRLAAERITVEVLSTRKGKGKLGIEGTELKLAVAPEREAVETSDEEDGNAGQ